MVVEFVTFDAGDRAYAGEMTITTTLAPVSAGTKVVVACENVPPGIREAIPARTISVRGGRDFWPRLPAVIALAADWTSASTVATLTIPDVTHFHVFNHPTRGRDTFVTVALVWLRSSPTGQAPPTSASGRRLPT